MSDLRRPDPDLSAAWSVETHVRGGCPPTFLVQAEDDPISDPANTRLMADMDSWGYTYRLGSTRAWFEQDAENARSWLDARGLLPA